MRQVVDGGDEVVGIETCGMLFSKVEVFASNGHRISFDLRYFGRHSWVTEAHHEAWGETKDFAFAAFLE